MISVVIPVYNRRDKIKHVVKCVLEQTHSDFELILVDDGSTDGSSEICDKLAEEDKRIRVIHQENAGVSQARNTGIKSANGEWLIFMDSDDKIKLDMHEKLLKTAQKNSADMVICGILNEFYNAEGKKIREEIISNEDEIVFDNSECVKKVLKLLRNSLVHSPVNKIYKMDVIKSKGLMFNPEISLGEDLIFNLEYIKAANKLAFISEPLYIYIASETDGLVSVRRENKHEIMTVLYENVLGFINCLGLENDRPENKTSADFLYVKWTYSCFIDLFKPNCNFSIKERKVYIKSIIEKTQVKNAAESNLNQGGFSGKLARAIYNGKLKSVYFYSKFMYISKFKLGKIYNKLLKKV